MKKVKKVLSFILIISLLGSLFVANTSAATLNNGSLYYIKNRRSNLYLTATSGNNLVQSSLTRNENQRFAIRKYQTINNIEYYYIIPDLDRNKNVDIANALDADHQNVGIFMNNPSYPQAQAFRFIKVGDYYKIMPLLSTTRVLDVTDASTANNANIQLFQKRANSDSLSSAQEWMLIGASKSLNSFDLVDSGKHLDYKIEYSEAEGYAHAAMLQWNSYKAGIVRKKSLLNTTDVTIKSSTSIAKPSLAVTTSSGEIKINPTEFNKLSQNGRINLLTHEIGHALGMGHLNSSANVLNFAVNEQTELKTNNKNSYDLAYNRY